QGGREDRNVAKRELLIVGDDLQFLHDGKASVTRAKIVIDPRRSPKTIDLKYVTGTASGKTRFGIYRFTDDGNLEICLTRETNEDTETRPTQFTTKPDVGSGDLMFIAEREQSKKETTDGKVDPKADPKTELKKFEGKWQVVKWEQGGRDDPNVKKREML